MQMDVGMDTGPILAMRATGIGAEETAIELSERLSRIGAELLSETLPKIERGEITPTSQNHDEATYAPMLKREDGLIDWRMEAREIVNRVRGFQPWPGAYTTFRGGRLMVWKAREAALNGEQEVAPATILSVEKSVFTVACANRTVLAIEEIQIEGKRRVSARDFLNGTRLGVGDRVADGL
jgi:methionyl-tRNA formyltransferase